MKDSELLATKMARLKTSLPSARELAAKFGGAAGSLPPAVIATLKREHDKQAAECRERLGLASDVSAVMEAASRIEAAARGAATIICKLSELGDALARDARAFAEACKEIQPPHERS